MLTAGGPNRAATPTLDSQTASRGVFQTEVQALPIGFGECEPLWRAPVAVQNAAWQGLAPQNQPEALSPPRVAIKLPWLKRGSTVRRAGKDRLLVLAFVTVLATAAFACPVWTSAYDHDSPCSPKNGASSPCPWAFYVTTPDLHASLAALAEAPPALVPPADSGPSARSLGFEQLEVAQHSGLSPPLFLKSHSFLI